MSDKKVIMYNSDEAAKQVTVTGWVGADGRFWGKDEHMARWGGCTHMACKCGEVMDKNYTICRACRDKASDERFAALERKLWDGKAPICIYGGDRYFWGEEDLMEYCEEFDCTPDDLQLVFCEPNYAREIEAGDHFDGLLGDDCDVPSDLEDAFEELNKIIRERKEPLSWSPGKIAVLMPEVPS